MRTIDVREYPEFASGFIEGSELIPLGNLRTSAASWDRSESITLVCRSGRRAEQAKAQLMGFGFQSVAVLEGGIEAWRRTGKPLSTLTRLPWSMERQVRIAAGSLVVVFVGLDIWISSAFLAGAALVGAGLVFAGVSDTCMMGRALAWLPWNRPERG